MTTVRWNELQPHREKTVSKKEKLDLPSWFLSLRLWQAAGHTKTILGWNAATLFAHYVMADGVCFFKNVLHERPWILWVVCWDESGLRVTMSGSKRHMGNQVLSSGETFALQILWRPFSLLRFSKLFLLCPAAFLEAVSFMLTPRDWMWREHMMRNCRKRSGEWPRS